MCITLMSNHPFQHTQVLKVSLIKQYSGTTCMRKSDSLQDVRDVLEGLVHQADLVHRVHHHNPQSPAVPTHQTDRRDGSRGFMHFRVQFQISTFFRMMDQRCLHVTYRPSFVSTGSSFSWRPRGSLSRQRFQSEISEDRVAFVIKL